MIGGRDIVHHVSMINQATRSAIYSNQHLWYRLVQSDYVSPSMVEKQGHGAFQIYQDYAKFQASKHLLLQDSDAVTPDDAIGAIRPLTGGLGVGLANSVVVMPTTHTSFLDQKVWWATVVSPRHADVDTEMVAPLRKRLEYGVCSPTKPLREQFRDLLLLFPPHQTVHLSVERTLTGMYDNEYCFPLLQSDTPNAFCQPVLRANDETVRWDMHVCVLQSQTVAFHKHR